MKEINEGIVFSYDIKKILNGQNAFDYKYNAVPSDTIINDVRNDFERDVKKIFKNKVVIISEEQMLRINNLIGGEYPHCYIG